MPLVIDGSLYSDVQAAPDFIFNSQYFKESSTKLLEKETEEVPPNGLLYVKQREFAVVIPTDAYIQVLGTEDATTCHMVVIRHTGSGVTALAHCDGVDTKGALVEMVDAITTLSKDKQQGRLEVHLVGGFMDSRQESIKLSTSILKALMVCSEEIHLLTACITNRNDTLKGDIHFPVIYGLAVNVQTGEVFPASFPQQGPELDVRSASNFGGCKKMLNIYETGTGVLKVGPFTWDPWDEVSLWCSLPDQFIRKYLSTSPAQEPAHFEDHVRASLKVLMHHPQPHLTLFPDGQPHRYHIQPDGGWKLLDTVPATS